MKAQRIPILRRLQAGVSKIRSRVRAGDQADPVAAGTGTGTRRFALEIPGVADETGKPSKPLWRVSVELHAEPHGDGEQLRLRMHWQANLASALTTLSLGAGRAEAVAGPMSRPIAGANAAAGKDAMLSARVADWLRKGAAQPLVQRIAAPLLQHDFNSWLELRASSADLADGAAALMPENSRLAGLGIEIPKGNGPLAQSWAGSTPGSPAGFAQLSLLRLDKKHLPTRLAAALGEKPFQLAAALVNVAEQPRRNE